MAAPRIAGRGVDRPGDVPAFVERDREPVAGVGLLPVALAAGPRHVVRCGAVARLARDVDLGEAGRETIGLRVVALVQIGRVALRAHEVPVLLKPGPVQRIAGPQRLVRVQVEPTLSALRAGSRVPGDAERLDAAVRELDQVLLQGRRAERVTDLEIGELPVRAVGVDEVLPAAPEERRGHTRVSELRVGEVSEHARLARLLHGEVVMRALPLRDLLRVTALAGRAPDVGRRRQRGRRRPRRGRRGRSAARRRCRLGTRRAPGPRPPARSRRAATPRANGPRCPAVASSGPGGPRRCGGIASAGSCRVLSPARHGAMIGNRNRRRTPRREAG